MTWPECVSVLRITDETAETNTVLWEINTVYSKMNVSKACIAGFCAIETFTRIRDILKMYGIKMDVLWHQFSAP